MSNSMYRGLGAIAGIVLAWPRPAISADEEWLGESVMVKETGI